jgi:1,4-alpha-glucan branching enzyme
VSRWASPISSSCRSPEHPYDAVLGLPDDGLYAPTAASAIREGFARFVDGATSCGIGVILDWVPAHFPTDAHGLAHFDGTALYEHADPRQGFHPDWNTAIYNFGRVEVVSFLINNALFWARNSCRRAARGCRRLDALSRLLAQARRVDPQRVRRQREPGAVRFLQPMNAAVYGPIPAS